MNLRETSERLGRGTIRHARAILFATAIILVLSAIAITRIGVDTDIAKMLPSDNPVAKSYTEITDEFETTSTLIALVEGPDRETLIRTAEALSSTFKTDGRTSALVRSVQYRFDRAFAERWGLLMQKSEDLADTERIFASTRLLPLLRTTNDIIEEKLADGDDEEVEGAEGEDDSYAMMSQFALFAEGLERAVSMEGGDVRGQAEGLADAWLFGEEYLLDPEGKSLLMVIRPSFDIGDRAKLTALSNAATEFAKEVTAKDARLSVSYTGDVQNEADEERAIGSDTFYPSLIAFGLIVILFFFSFNRRRTILFALAALAAGIVIDLAFAALTVRNLNMVTSSFGALLVGLGIDFGIHIVSRFDEETHKGEPPEEAMGKIFAKAGVPIAIGGLTTALAFYSLMLTKTLAFRQFGLIAGTGVVITLATAFIVLPALLGAFPGKERQKRRRQAFSFIVPTKVALFSRKHRVAIFSAVAMLTALSFFGIPRNGFDYDMRNIGPQDTQAKRTEDAVARRFGISTWQHLAQATSVEEARALAEAFKDAPFVRRVESVADYIPSPFEQEERLKILARLETKSDRAAGATWTEDDVTAFSDEVQRLEWNMIELGDLAAASLGERSLPVRKRNAMIREILGTETGQAGAEVFARLRDRIAKLDPSEAARRLTQIDDAFATALDRKFGALARPGRMVGISDLPESARLELINPDGDRFLVIIQGSAGLSGQENFVRFADGLAAVDPRATGTLSLGLALGREILNESRTAAIIVLALIFALVAVGYRSIKPTIVTFLAFAAAIAWMFGLYPLFGKFNIVNALALPLIIGMGIDYCVHVASALSEEGDTVVALRKTGKAVTLSALTTLIGFGSLALVGKFKGIADLGVTLSIGIFFCYLVAIVVIPAALAPAARDDVSTLKEESK